MSNQYDITVIGGDLRQVYMVKKLINKGYSVVIYGIANEIINGIAGKATSLAEALSKSSIILCPIPFTKNQFSIENTDGCLDATIDNLLINLSPNQILFGGNIPTKVYKFCEQHSIQVYDFMKMNDVAILNAVATAEGAIAEAIKRSLINMHQSNCLVLGFGRCAQILAKKLYALDANVCVGARNNDARSTANAFGYSSISLNQLDENLLKFDYIFNTIPECILTKEKLEKVSREVTIIDIASSPGGLDYSVTQNLGINANLCLGLPGKYSPKTSGEILVNAIENIINERRD
ncbi:MULTISPECIES: dipicolinate synthase subunit DpsA [unclassified Clostridioides]|uniref:dipicolinate synthase subunit DpsA n=1 Tax=unclassified Clostridioides TaxID=2635829 RepID=UPI001D0C1794|nr:dipicolinate synthase subunit DpsA [Clostridioides sp. ES-S-0001-03]MCC0655889.1 dipicolinate synthase subunit DpsA [Clostridioides sp. ES-S-0123-01]MCC0680674.1 dipicolinate synthase subunit DpsA [Clostridioides sp. ES-S-0005-03]MCC0694731.1 dipicolinate synthase subunit DpsA [Clostridioides sp. ES-S-0048-02]MCC0702917.1 dipicolinate synthase subunit DpsA [Clostridioides sp. ES-S-0049-02]MCC0706334.1 dipicolinate synthase subunit DpsA [Clostridioides sp. ES-S-0190-01]UDN46886.1 dipicolina